MSDSRGRLVAPALLLAALSAGGCSSEPPVAPAAPAESAVDPRGAVETEESWRRSIETFRAEREKKLRAPDGWLSVVDLIWLRSGENRVGSDPELEVVLPERSAAGLAGSFLVEDGDGSAPVVVRWRPAPGGPATIDGEPASEREVRDDTTGAPDRFQVGDVQFYLIRRGERLGVRVKDPQSEALSRFEGLDHFPIDPAYRVQARLAPFDPPREVEVATVVGTSQTYTVPGRLEFELDGRPERLEPYLTDSDPPRLFIIFKDTTAGRETYGAGRYLYTDFDPAEPFVELDFNRAYTPPCGFTSHATCPLPRPENRLDRPIEAGERFSK